MDLGEPFKHEMRIRPGADGSFVVVLGEAVDHGRTPAPFFAFTTIDDLLIWMAKHGARSHITELKQGDIVGNGTPEFFDAICGNGLRRTELKESQIMQGAGVAGALCGMDALYGLRRTTAAEVIRERDARQQANDGRKQALAHPAPTPNDAA